MFLDISNKSLLAQLDKVVFGHTAAKKALISLVNRSKIRHYQKYMLLEDSCDLLEPAKVLLIGETGTGKTYLVECLQKLVDFPLLKLDATHLTLTSASDGTTPEKVRGKILDLVKTYKKNKEACGYTCSFSGVLDQVVVFIDEFDKLGLGKEEGDQWNKRVQASFLSILDNYDDLAGVSFIFAGAFSGYEKYINKSNTSIGFLTSNGQDKVQNDIDFDDIVVKMGLIPEIVGRLTNIVALDKLTEPEYGNIINNFLLPKLKKDLLCFKVNNFELSKDDINDIIDKAIKTKQGVRALKRELNRIVSDIEFNHEELQITQSL